MEQKERRTLLIQELLKEDPQYSNLKVPGQDDEEGQKSLLRALMNIRLPGKVSEDFLKLQDEYLQERVREKGVVDIDDLNPVKDGIYIWQGDITRLKCDAIVNAANSGMTGCYIANHACIDNCIHTYAGVQMRLACAELMERQGHEEPTGKAKITEAYNLPCRYVIHTVGPIVRGELTERDCELLKSCYESCLRVAELKGLESIAFCCVSTGIFSFPNDRAAEIAVGTVEKFLEQSTNVRRVIFNVFKEFDKEIYESLLCM